MDYLNFISWLLVSLYIQYFDGNKSIESKTTSVDTLFMYDVGLKQEPYKD